MGRRRQIAHLSHLRPQRAPVESERVGRRASGRCGRCPPKGAESLSEIRAPHQRVAVHSTPETSRRQSLRQRGAKIF